MDKKFLIDVFKSYFSDEISNEVIYGQSGLAVLVDGGKIIQIKIGRR